MVLGPSQRVCQPRCRICIVTLNSAILTALASSLLLGSSARPFSNASSDSTCRLRACRLRPVEGRVLGGRSVLPALKRTRAYKATDDGAARTLAEPALDVRWLQCHTAAGVRQRVLVLSESNEARSSVTAWRHSAINTYVRTRVGQRDRRTCSTRGSMVLAPEPRCSR